MNRNNRFLYIIIFCLACVFVVVLKGKRKEWIRHQAVEKTIAELEDMSDEFVLDTGAAMRFNQLLIIDTLNTDVLYEAMKTYQMIFPDVVCAQAVLESNWFKSDVYKKHNNFLGIRKGNGEYQYFNHWTDCLLRYKKIQQRYKGDKKNTNEYLQFLNDIGYAEDTTYVETLKVVMMGYMFYNPADETVIENE